MAGYLRVVLAVLMVLGYSSTIWAMEAELKCSACEAVVRMLMLLNM
jgi:hypothetical protein